MNVSRFRIRPFETSDAASVCEIYYRSVHGVAIAKYTQAQVDAWAPQVPEASSWLPSLSGYHTYLAVDEEDRAVAWISMTSAGYVDMLFCLPEALGRGVAGKLYDTVEQMAIERGLTGMTTHASLLAQPFFAKRGWNVVKHEFYERNGVALPRAEMSKELNG